jgi:hypothetical protein
MFALPSEATHRTRPPGHHPAFATHQEVTFQYGREGSLGPKVERRRRRGSGVDGWVLGADLGAKATEGLDGDARYVVPRRRAAERLLAGVERSLHHQSSGGHDSSAAAIDAVDDLVGVRHCADGHRLSTDGARADAVP